MLSAVHLLHQSSRLHQVQQPRHIPRLIANQSDTASIGVKSQRAKARSRYRLWRGPSNLLAVQLALGLPVWR